MIPPHAGRRMVAWRAPIRDHTRRRPDPPRSTSRSPAPRPPGTPDCPRTSSPRRRLPRRRSRAVGGRARRVPGGPHRPPRSASRSPARPAAAPPTSATRIRLSTPALVFGVLLVGVGGAAAAHPAHRHQPGGDAWPLWLVVPGVAMPRRVVRAPAAAGPRARDRGRHRGDDRADPVGPGGLRRLLDVGLRVGARRPDRDRASARCSTGGEGRRRAGAQRAAVDGSSASPCSPASRCSSRA